MISAREENYYGIQKLAYIHVYLFLAPQLYKEKQPPPKNLLMVRCELWGRRSPVLSVSVSA